MLRRSLKEEERRWKGKIKEEEADPYEKKQDDGREWEK